MTVHSINQSTSSSNLGDILEKILDKGVVIAGDISIAIADIELLTIRIRLVIASVDKAKEMGIDWWRKDPYLSSHAKIEQEQKEEEMKLLEDQKSKQVEDLLKQNQKLLEKVKNLEEQIKGGGE